MALLVLEDVAATAEFYPPVRPSSVTCALYDSGGTLIGASLTTSVDTFAATIATVTDSTTFTATVSAGTPRIGRRYWYVSANTYAHESLVRLGELASTSWQLEAPPATSSVVATDMLKGARCTASLTTTHTATRGTNFRLEWTVTDAGGTVSKWTQIVHVVKQFFRDPVLPDEAARYLSVAFPGRATAANAGYFREVGERSSARVWRKLWATQRWPWLVGDQEAFRDCGTVALRIELSLDGLVPPGFDPSQYRRQQEDELDRQFQEAIAQLWIDSGDDGGVTAEEPAKRFNVSMVRA